MILFWTTTSSIYQNKGASDPPSWWILGAAVQKRRSISFPQKYNSFSKPESYIKGQKMRFLKLGELVGLGKNKLDFTISGKMFETNLDKNKLQKINLEP